MPRKRQEGVIDWPYLIEKGITTDIAKCIEFLREQGVLARQMHCSRCNSEMKEETVPSRAQDKTRFRCPHQECRQTTTIRKNSVFESSRLDLTTILLIFWLWATHMDQDEIAHMTRTSTKTVSVWCHKIRQICTSDLVRNNTSLIGSSTEVCSVDETHLAKRLRGANGQARPTPGTSVWLLAGISHSTKKIFCRIIPPPGRTKEVLHGLIAQHVAPGSTIWTDEWRSYRGLEDLGLGYKHRTVCHKYRYVSEDLVCTNMAENLFSQLKAHLRTKRGCARHRLSQYIDEFVWLRAHQKNKRFSELLKALSTDPRYPVNVPGDTSSLREEITPYVLQDPNPDTP